MLVAHDSGAIFRVAPLNVCFIPEQMKVPFLLAQLRILFSLAQHGDGFVCLLAQHGGGGALFLVAHHGGGFVFIFAPLNILLLLELLKVRSLFAPIECCAVVALEVSFAHKGQPEKEIPIVIPSLYMHQCSAGCKSYPGASRERRTVEIGSICSI